MRQMFSEGKLTFIFVTDGLDPYWQFCASARISNACECRTICEPLVRSPVGGGTDWDSRGGCAPRIFCPSGLITIEVSGWGPSRDRE